MICNEIATKFPEMIMTVQSKEGRDVLKSYGWNLKHLLVFDGHPQYFPTDSGAYYGLAKKDEIEFLADHGYPIRGTLPKTSLVTQVHTIVWI